ncbi:MAG: peptidase A4 [Thaumarchaeota archaeon]|nr:peptidase A4 [Nitrososphaerota archaeon]
MHPRARLAFSAVIISFLVLPIFALAVPTTTAVVARSNVRAGNFSSTNWSGYAVTGSTGSVTDVKGSWIVPAIQGECTSTNQYSSFWVGIDGFNSGTVEQTGTDSDCQGGLPTYYAWYEFYPHPAFYAIQNIHPGDVITAEVKVSGRTFIVTITDVTTGQTFSKNARLNSAQKSSAEWIAEAPSSSGGILPLANFGTVKFGLDYTGISSTNFATVGGVTQKISGFGANVQTITMVSQSGGAVKAQPSALSPDGTSFTVAWKSSGP